MRLSFLLSMALHVLIIGSAFVVLPSPWNTAPPPPVFVPIEIVTIGDETDIAAAAPEPEPEPEAATEPEPAPEPDPIDVAEAIPEPEPEPVAEPEEEVYVPTPEEIAEAEPQPEPQEPAAQPPTEQQVAQVTPRQKPPQDNLDLGRLSALIDKARDDETPRPAPREAPAEAPGGPPEAVDRPRQSAGLGQGLTLSEEDALRMQMQRCWTIPAGAPEPEKLIVRVRVKLNIDGSINGAPQILDQARIAVSGDPYLRLAAESAQRAVVRCAPYRLPPEKYDNGWEQITMTFNPADMVGR